MDRLQVVLVRSRNPLNIGAAARAMSNFGFRTLRLVAPWEPSYLEARSAVGAAEVLLNSQVYGSVAEAVADCTLVVGTSAMGARELHHPVHLVPDASEMIRTRLTQSPVALLFGSEKTGLSNQEMSHCQCMVRIPTRQEHLSMNLGQAVAVTLYELSRTRGLNEGTSTTGGARGQRAAESAQLEQITEAFCEALSASGSPRYSAESAAQEKLRRMIRRLRLNHADAETLLSVMRKIVWKLKRDETASKQ